MLPDLKKYNFFNHLYADDTLLYLPLKLDDLRCFNSLYNHTEFSTVINTLGPLLLTFNSNARNLGVIFDSVLKFDQQIIPLD